MLSITSAILCYNYGRFLANAIDGCLAQKGEGFSQEILVIDDGSTDETPDVCARYGSAIRVSRTPNQGFPASLTRAVKEATGDYVALLDADDAFLPGKLAALTEAFRQGKRFVQHDMILIDESGKEIGKGIGGNTSTIAFRRKEALDILPVQNELDYHLIANAGWGTTLHAPLTQYRIHAKSMTDRSAAGAHARYFANAQAHAYQKAIRIANSNLDWVTNRSAFLRECQSIRLVGLTAECEALIFEKKAFPALAVTFRMLIERIFHGKLDQKSLRIPFRWIRQFCFGIPPRNPVSSSCL